jgi:predicted DNA-binding transcriptional regulator YafY
MNIRVWVHFREEIKDRTGSDILITYMIQQAIYENKQIEIIYLSEKGITERIINPIKLEAEFIEAYCTMRRAIRHFKIENILGAKILNHRKVG